MSDVRLEELLRRLGRNTEARAAYERALSLARTEPERRFLAERVAGGWGSSHNSPRRIFWSSGATTPMRTRLPWICKTVIVMPAPIRILSHCFRLSTSMGKSSLIGLGQSYTERTFSASPGRRIALR